MSLKPELVYQKSMGMIRAMRLAEDLKLSKPLQLRLVKKFWQLSEGHFDQLQSDMPSVHKDAVCLNDPGRIQSLLNHLIAGNAAWEQIRPLALQLVSLKPSDKTAAWYCELCFLHGGPDEACQAVRHYMSWFSLDFYHQIHPRVRDRLAARFVTLGWRRQLGSFLSQSQSYEWFRKSEKGIYFLWLADEKRNEEAFAFFQEFHREIVKLSDCCPDSSVPGSSGMLLQAARIGLALGRVQEAELLCRKIPSSALEYTDALEVINQSGIRGDSFQRSDLRQGLLRAQDQNSRLDILKDFMIRVRKQGKDLTGDWRTLDVLCQELPDWFDLQPDIQEKLAFLFIEMKDLSSCISHYWSYFIADSVRILPAEQDLARWRPFVLSAVSDLPAMKFLRGVALLRLCLHEGQVGEDADESVFRGRDLIEEALAQTASALRPSFPSWDSLWSIALGYISGRADMPSAKKKAMLFLLQAARAGHHMLAQDIENYLSLPEADPPAWVLTQFMAEARRQQSLEWEYQTLIRMPSKFCCYTNSELRRLWYISARKGWGDLGWRCLSVLSCRETLPMLLEKHLLISGERRQRYSWTIPGAREIDSCLMGFSPEQSRFVWACLKVGAKLPALLNKTEHGSKLAKVFRFKHVFEKSEESDRILDQIRWLQEKPECQLKEGELSEHLYIPAFCDTKTLPDNPWSHLIAQIAFRMSPGLWRWRTEELIRMLNDLQPVRRDTWKPVMSAKEGSVEKWMRTLDHEQRNAWHDLSQMSCRVSNEDGFFALAVFMCRLATVIYPDHYGALQSLQVMQAPTFMIWELEKWMLSPAYSSIRKSAKTVYPVDIPPSLMQNPVLS